MPPLIIERPDLQTAAQKIGKVSITLVCWVIWLYLFVPLVSLAAWAIGATITYDVIVVQLSMETALERAASYGYIVLVLALIFISWALYNYLRWRGVDRRSSPEPVSLAELAESFSLAVERVKELQAAKVATLTEAELAEMFDRSREEPQLPPDQSDLEPASSLTRPDKAA